jgi:hypothetical protein
MRFLLIFLLLFLNFCQSSKNTKKINPNEFSQAFQDLDEEVRKKLLDSPLDFLEWTFQFESQRDWVKNPQSLESQWPKIPLHGNLRADDIILLKGDGPSKWVAFQKLESSFEGPITWDLFTLEVSSLFISQYLRLGEKNTKSCLRTYANTMKHLSTSQAVPPPFSDIATHTIELNSSKSTPNVYDFIKNLFIKNFHTNAIQAEYSFSPQDPQMRSIILIKDEKGDYWRVAPLSHIEKCSDFNNLFKAYTPYASLFCAQLKDQGNYLIQKLPASTQVFSLMDLNSVSDLERSQTSMCSWLARAHSQFLSNSEKRKVYLIMTQHPSWMQRWQEKIRLHTMKALDAFRLSLK